MAMGSGVTVRLFTCSRSEPGPQFDHEKPKPDDVYEETNRRIEAKCIVERLGHLTIFGQRPALRALAVAKKATQMTSKGAVNAMVR